MSAAKKKVAVAGSAAAAAGCPPLGKIILDLGGRLGALDRTSRLVMVELLSALVAAPDDAPEIARLAGVLATVQKPMARDAALNRALTRPDALEYVSRKGEQS